MFPDWFVSMNHGFIIPPNKIMWRRQIKSHDLGGRLTGPFLEITLSLNCSFKLIDGFSGYVVSSVRKFLCLVGGLTS